MATHQTNCDICNRLAAIREGKHPAHGITVIAELDTGFAVMGDSQFFRGYSLLLCKSPATELDELPHAIRLRFLEEMSQLAEAVRNATGAFKLNYESLGNLVHHLHWHVFPRRESDPDPKAPVWGQMPKLGSDADTQSKFNPERDRGLLESIRAEVHAIRARANQVHDSANV
jgi:diadenosine tetraphosphate (Ap4A) HIT family hydrolase